MKRSFFALLVVFFVATSCEKEICGCVQPPEGSSLHGNWEFVRVNYPMDNQPITAKDLGYSEQLKIAADSKTFLRYRDGQIVENTDFKLSTQEELKTIIFKKDNTYSTYSLFMENDKLILSLYERSPVGAVLMDGGTYYYQKK